jgi:hypothetical protein
MLEIMRFPNQLALLVVNVLRCTVSEPCISCAGTFVYGGNGRAAKPPRN